MSNKNDYRAPRKTRSKQLGTSTALQKRDNNLLTKIRSSTLLSFSVLGLINTAVGATIMFVFYNVFHFSYWVSTISNYVVGGTLNYILNRKYTFHYEGPQGPTIVRYVINVICCYTIAYSIAKPLIAWIFSAAHIGAQENIAMVAGMCIYGMINYFSQRFFVFRKSKEE